MEGVVSDETAHTLSKKLLQNRAGTSADTLFKSFVRKAYKDHGVKPFAPGMG